MLVIVATVGMITILTLKVRLGARFALSNVRNFVRGEELDLRLLPNTF